MGTNENFDQTRGAGSQGPSIPPSGLQNTDRFSSSDAPYIEQQLKLLSFEGRGLSLTDSNIDTAIERVSTQLADSGISRAVWNYFLDCAPYHFESSQSLERLTEKFLDLWNVQPSDAVIGAMRDVHEAAKANQKTTYSPIDLMGRVAMVSRLGRSESVVEGYVRILQHSEKRGLSAKKERAEVQAYWDLLDRGVSDKLLSVLVSTVENAIPDERNKVSFAYLSEMAVKPADRAGMRESLQQMLEHHTQNEFGVCDLIDVFRGLSGKPIEPEMRRVIREVIPHHRENGWRLEVFLARMDRLVTGTDWTSYRKALRECLDAKVPPEVVSSNMPGYIRPITDEQSKTLFRVAKKLTEITTLRADVAEILNIQDEAFGTLNFLFQLGADPRIANKMISVVDLVDFPTANTLARQRIDLVAHASVRALVSGGDVQATRLARTALNRLTYNDHPPFIIRDKENGPVHEDALEFYRQTQQVYRRLFDTYDGFSALTFEARTRGELPAALAEFGQDISRSVHVINARDIDDYPGRGYLFDGLRREQFLVADTAGSAEPYVEYKMQWPWLAKDLDDVEHTKFAVMRGMIAVIPPADNDKYIIHGVHYSYVVRNEHFHDSWCDVGFLVPTEVLTDKLQHTLIPIDEYDGPSNRIQDVNHLELIPEELQAECSRRGLNLLNLGWGSNIGGGLCNAFPPDSKPYHEWEEFRRSAGETTDYWGHVHKSHMLGGYRYKMDAELEKAMLPFREAHKLVFDATTSMQNLLSIFQIAQSFWHKGQTKPSPKKQQELNRDMPELEGVDGEDPGEENDESAEQGNVPTEYSDRMLRQAYQWHKLLMERGAEQHEYPVLCSADLRYYGKSPTAAILDTYSLTVRANKAWQELPGADDLEVGYLDSELWHNEVFSKVPYAHDLRWYDRRALPQEWLQ